MPPRQKIQVEFIETAITIGELFVLSDVGGFPALPAIDGSQLTGITASAEPCVSRDITSKTIQTRETCFFNEPVITGTITIQGDGRMLVI